MSEIYITKKTQCHESSPQPSIDHTTPAFKMCETTDTMSILWTYQTMIECSAVADQQCCKQ